MKPRVTSRVPSNERRAQILRVATEMFARRGFHGTTTRGIADRVGIKETILFRLFPSKRDLYWAILDEKCRERSGRQRLEMQLASGSDERAMFTSIAVGILERNIQDTTLARLWMFSGLEEHELSDRFFDTYIAQFHETLAAYVQRRIEEGAYRKIDPLIAARSFIGMVFYQFLMEALFNSKRAKKFPIESCAAAVADIWLKGVRA